MRIGFAFNEKPALVTSSMPSSPPSPLDDRYAEWDDADTIARVEKALAAAGSVMRLEANDEFPQLLREARPDLVFNIAEGADGPNREAHVPAICEFWSVPYTGSDPMTLSICLDKGRTKEILAYHRIPTAAFSVVHGPDEMNGFSAWPAIVKPVHEGSSKGITTDSYCQTRAQARDAVATVVARYGQPALVERWLPGREFTCAILGNGDGARVLPIVEVDFGALPPGARRLYSYEAKWIWDTPDRPLEIFHCPADVPRDLGRQIERTALAAYHVLRCRDWARIDLRCDAQGVPHVLEINPLPGILPDPAMNSCYPKAARAAGLDYDTMILAVLRAGAARHAIRV